MLYNSEFQLSARSLRALQLLVGVSKIEFSAGKGLEIIYKFPVDSALYNSELHVSACSLAARNCVSVFRNNVFPK